MGISGPVIVGGMGGSGSRPIVRLLIELRWSMTARRNEPQEDALDVVEFDYRWTPPFVNGQADVERMRREFDDDILPKLMPGGRWGWKHNPSAHLLPFYAERFPDLRFVHIVRDGRDAALGRTGGQVHTLRLGRALLDGDPRPVTPDHPAWEAPWETADGGREGTWERRAAFWAKVNRDTADFGEDVLGERYLRVRLEDLVADPGAGAARIADFLGAGVPPPSAAKVFERSGRLGRGRERDLGAAESHMRTELVRFGYLDQEPETAT